MIDNESEENGVFGIATSQLLVLESSIISNNKSAGDNSIMSGIGISYSFPIEITDCTFENNSAISSSGLFFMSAKAILTRCNFINNSATETTSNISGILAMITIEGCNFSYEEGRTDPNRINGEDISIDTQSEVYISGSTFTNSFAVNGGSIYLSGCTITSFIKHLFYLDSSLDIQNSQFTCTMASNLGGAIYAFSYAYIY
jgi:hypothetical protein